MVKADGQGLALKESGQGQGQGLMVKAKGQ